MPLRNKDFREMYGQQMIKFAISTKVIDLVEIKVPTEANPVKGERSKVASRKGGKPPVDYTAVEMLVDMQNDLLMGNWRDAYSAYVMLKRLMGLS